MGRWEMRGPVKIPAQGTVSTSNRAVTALFITCAIGFAFGTVALWYSRPLVTGSPGDATYPIVLGLLVATIVACFVGAFRFPTEFRLTPGGLVIRYLHRTEVIAVVTVRDIQVRGGAVNRNLWLVLRDGSERPLGTRNVRLAAAWQSLSEGTALEANGH